MAQRPALSDHLAAIAAAINTTVTLPLLPVLASVREETLMLAQFGAAARPLAEPIRLGAHSLKIGSQALQGCRSFRLRPDGSLHSREIQKAADRVMRSLQGQQKLLISALALMRAEGVPEPERLLRGLMEAGVVRQPGTIDA